MLSLTWYQQLRKIAFSIINSTTILLPMWFQTLEKMKLKERKMPRDVSTRWNSTFDMLDFALEYRTAIDECDQQQNCRSAPSMSLIVRSGASLTSYALRWKFCWLFLIWAFPIHTLVAQVFQRRKRRFSSRSTTKPCDCYPGDGSYWWGIDDIFANGNIIRTSGYPKSDLLGLTILIDINLIGII